ncbi:pyridoxamine 5'-phosphate oxidase family protein [Streptomyces tateyamensis]|nr:pyridoxamine 5'-phosphate oxidase family protein [Streptomyces tateyamensis]
MTPPDAPEPAPVLTGLRSELAGSRTGDACTRAQSLDLLRQLAVGRLIHTEDALPAVTPTCYVLDSADAVVIPLPAGSRLATSLENAVVGFQADLLDGQTRRGWTVLVIGRSHLLTEPARLADLHQHGPHPWGHSDAHSYLRIDPELVTGTRLGA